MISVCIPVRIALLAIQCEADLAFPVPEKKYMIILLYIVKKSAKQGYVLIYKERSTKNTLISSILSSTNLNHKLHDIYHIPVFENVLSFYYVVK